MPQPIRQPFSSRQDNFSLMPGTNYVLESTKGPGPNASWLQLFATNAPGNGQFTILDQAASGNQQSFYRLRH